MTIQTGAQPRLTMVVLCGGRSSRMQGIDKPLLPVAHDGCSQPMIDHVIDATPGIAKLLISANRHIKDYARRGQVIADAELAVTAEGPLMGVLAGLLNANTEWLLICPGDTPFLGRDWHLPLITAAAAAEPNLQGILVHDGERLQPLHALVRCELADHLLNYLSRGGRSAIGWLNALHTLSVAYDSPARFTSVNRFEDLDPLNS